MGMQFRPRMSDFSVSGAQAGTFENAFRKGERESAYWKAVEADVNKKMQQRRKVAAQIPNKTRKIGPVPLT